MWRQVVRHWRRLPSAPSPRPYPSSLLAQTRVVPRAAACVSHFSTDFKPSNDTSAAPRRIGDDIKEFNERIRTGTAVTFDTQPLSPSSAPTFPRIKTTSLSTKRIVIHDEALANPVTLVLLAFRSFADEQLQTWRRAFESARPGEHAQWFDVTINESFGAQALSGFVQRLQRGWTDPTLHDYYVAFNSRAREPLEAVLPSRNRMFGYVLLLDGKARVRFRASGVPTEEGLKALVECTKSIASEANG